MNKTKKVLDYLVKNKEITRKELLDKVGRTNGTSIIHSLQSHGVDIKRYNYVFSKDVYSYELRGFKHQLYLNMRGELVSPHNNKRNYNNLTKYKPSNWLPRMFYKLKKYLGCL